jgi:hypothetical protein
VIVHPATADALAAELLEALRALFEAAGRNAGCSRMDDGWFDAMDTARATVAKADPTLAALSAQPRTGVRDEPAYEHKDLAPNSVGTEGEKP